MINTEKGGRLGLEFFIQVQIIITLEKSTDVETLLERLKICCDLKHRTQTISLGFEDL